MHRYARFPWMIRRIGLQNSNLQYSAFKLQNVTYVGKGYYTPPLKLKREKEEVGDTWFGDYEFKKTYNNDRNLSEIQLEHKKEDELVVVVVNVVHECRRWMGDCKWILGGSKGESFWEEGDDFGVDVLRFHTCHTDIIGFLEKLELWFEQDIDD
ncbi:hypothetical protein Tco_0959679 [Tanacetum coccineum]